MSKKHPGTSNKYKNMIEKRDLNKQKRDFHNLIKHFLTTSSDSKLDFKNYSRLNTIRNNLKTEISKENKAKGLD